jgi:hypothetical protein
MPEAVDEILELDPGAFVLGFHLKTKSDQEFERIYGYRKSHIRALVDAMERAVENRDLPTLRDLFPEISGLANRGLAYKLEDNSGA